MAAPSEQDSGIDLDSLLARLDTDQLAAVTAPPGPVAVLAGAGSGKTRVLTTRIAYRIATGEARPAHVVAFTFTRQAASELQRRLMSYGAGRDVVAGTFHSVAYRILRRRWEDRGRTEPPTLATDRLGLLTEHLEGDRRLATQVINEIEWCRARLVEPDDYAGASMAAGRRSSLPADRVATIYRGYEAAKRKRRILDFDDLLSECVAELSRPGVGDAVAWWHRHLHVDEYQDINPLQHQFLETLRNGATDLFVVGDPAQAIYGWNGADPRLLDQLTESTLRPVVVRLPTNYRSTPEVVEAGDRVLATNKLGGTHRSARPTGAGVVTVAAADEADEARRIVALAASLRMPGAPWSSVAVLARTHETLRTLALAFDRVGVPTRTVTRAGSPSTTGPAALLRAARAARDADELHTWAVDLAWPAPETGDEADDLPEVGRGATGPAMEDARHAVHVVKAFEAAGGGSGRAFTAWAALNDIESGTDRDAVELVTMHAAKGREWPVVIVAGIDTVGFPAPAAARSPVRAEEARLLYVALTRAVDRLAVTWAETRNGAKAGRSPLLPEFEPVAVPEPVAPPIDLSARRRRAGAPAPDPALARLREWRSNAARLTGVPATFVLDDATLERLVAARPRDLVALEAVEGIGPLLARRFGDRLLAALLSRP